MSERGRRKARKPKMVDPEKRSRPALTRWTRPGCCRPRVADHTSRHQPPSRQVANRESTIANRRSIIARQMHSSKLRDGRWTGRLIDRYIIHLARAYTQYPPTDALRPKTEKRKKGSKAALNQRLRDADVDADQEKIRMNYRIEASKRKKGGGRSGGRGRKKGVDEKGRRTRGETDASGGREKPHSPQRNPAQPYVASVDLIVLKFLGFLV